MNNLLKAVLLPALTKLTDWTSASVSASTGGYAGIDLGAGQPFEGLQGRLQSPGGTVQLAPSVEGNALGSADRWQVNADVLYPFGASGAPFTPYAGAGLCVVGTPGEDSSSVGFNLTGGANMNIGPLRAFAQLRLTVADGVHLSLTGGALPNAD